MFNRALSEEIHNLVAEETKDSCYAALTRKNKIHLEGNFTIQTLEHILELVRAHTDSEQGGPKYISPLTFSR